MIPLRLKISGFLSYRETTELDFTGFDLACISGANGAGKSTLLDAITWALFGQARRRDDAIVNLQSESAEVAFSFQYENADYRVIRSLRRGKAGNLELQARQTIDAAWQPLTERTQRETQARLEDILRLDYDTFINASFFLQGKADIFAQQTPSRRKEVLGTILGMELWEKHKATTAERRRRSEAELAAIMARIAEVGAELAEEPQRRRHLQELETDLEQLAATRRAQQVLVENLRHSRALLEKQRTLLTEQNAALDGLRGDIESLESRLQDRETARRETAELTRQAKQIAADYAAWRQTQIEVERWEGIARNFRDHEARRAPMLQQIAVEHARLEQEKVQLQVRESQVEVARRAVGALAKELEDSKSALSGATQRREEQLALQDQLTAAREEQAGMLAENKHLKEQMDDLKRRIEALESASGATCPLCGQALTRQHRLSTIERLHGQGRELGDRYRVNSARMQDLRDSIGDMQARLTATKATDEDQMAQSRTVAALMERLESLQRDIVDWETGGKDRLAGVARALATDDYAEAARRQLAALDEELAQVGYDAAAHDAVRKREIDLRSSEHSHSRLQAARAALAPLENEIRNLQAHLRDRSAALERQSLQVAEAKQAYDALAAATPEVAESEQRLFELQEQENRLHQDVGAARQKVSVLTDLKQRELELQSSRQDLAILIGRHKMLEAAFGRDGVPALLIEQALPELEGHANDILDRLSDGRMSVHFETQATYRDRKREDLRETLDIKISDGAGQRTYEMYSGGEAFRVNFAIRLALSQLLAGRTGARLQTLVIDEGFGSQDAQGIQRLIETINVIRPLFAKILLISHLDELKDAFPTRIEVEKDEHGSRLRVN